MKIAVVVPVFNEDKHIKVFLHSLSSELREASLKCTVIVVDDGSVDGTAQSVQTLLPKLFESGVFLCHRRNQGKGAALRTGADYALRKKCDAMIFMDGDCQHSPRHLRAFVTSLQKSALVFGYRDFADQMVWPRRLANTLISFAMRQILQQTRRDVLCGFIGMKREAYQQLSWTTCDYGVELEIAVIAAKKRLSFAEVQIDTVYLDKKTGLNIFDMQRVLWKLPGWLMKRYA